MREGKVSSCGREELDSVSGDSQLHYICFDATFGRTVQDSKDKGMSASADLYGVTQRKTHHD